MVENDRQPLDSRRRCRILSHGENNYTGNALLSGLQWYSTSGADSGGGLVPEFHRVETVLLVKLASRTVLLMCVQFQSIRGQALGEDDQTRSPAFAPFAGINIHSIDVRALHREIRDNLFVECPPKSCIECE